MRRPTSSKRGYLTLAALLATSTALAMLPESARTQCQSTVQRALLWPHSVLTSSSPNISHSADASALARRVEELEMALAAMEERSRDDNNGTVSPYLVRAQVLGRMTRRYLDPSALLGVGLDENCSSESLVLEVPPMLIDRGSRDATQVDNLLLAGRHVWGKVMKVGTTTALGRHVAEQGYRDVVELAQQDGDKWHRVARGLLEGCGQALCRIRYVDSTAAVSVGDWVVASGLDGLVDAPLLYGRIVRAERAPAGAHWDLWMEPAAKRDVSQVEILGGRSHTDDVAQHPNSTRR